MSLDCGAQAIVSDTDETIQSYSLAAQQQQLAMATTTITITPQTEDY